MLRPRCYVRALERACKCHPFCCLLQARRVQVRPIRWRLCVRWQSDGVARELATEEPAPEECSAGASSQPHFLESEASRVGAFDKEPSSSSSDSESSSDTESIPDEGRIPKPGDQLARVEWARFGDVFENPNSRKLHLRPTGSTTMACGRPEKGLVLFKSRIFEEGDKCQQCAAAKPVRTLAGLNQQLDERSKKSARTSA